MKTAQDFEDELFDLVKTSYGDLNFVTKIPKLSILQFKNGENLFALKKVTKKANFIDENYNILNNDIDTEALVIDKILKTNEDTSYIEFYEDTYVCFTMKESEKIDFDNLNDIKILLSGLYSFHKQVENIKVENPIVKEFDLYKEIDSLHSTKKIVSNLKKKSDFDFQFLKDYEKTYEKCDTLSKRLEDNEVFTSITNQVIYNDNYYCKQDEKLYLSTPLSLLYGNKYEDVATAIKKIIKKSELELKILDLIHMYDSNISNDEIEIIEVMLLFPTKYIDIVSLNYTKKRNFLPSAVKNEISKIDVLNEKILASMGK